MFSLDFLQEILFKIFAEQKLKKQQNQKIFRNKKKILEASLKNC